MKDEPRSPTRHKLEHTVPTVIHHPEEDMPLLARWLERAMENRTRFWGLLGGLAVVVIGLAVLVNGLELGRTTSDEAWTKLERAKTPSERVELAQDYPNTQAERWALLQAATEYYNQGFTDLPANRDVALPVLKKALNLFDRVVRESPPDAPQTRVAALGLAQTLEARNEIDKAITQYKRVAATWKGSDEARQAEAKIQALSKPENLAFYKELYACKPPEVTLPPGGRSGLPLPPDHPSIGGPSMLPPPVIVPPPPSPEPKAKPKPEADPPLGAMPDDILAPAPKPEASAPKPEPALSTPEPEAPAPKTEAAKKAEDHGTDFPDDILAPEPKPGAPKR
jgi:hypothetical protein